MICPLDFRAVSSEQRIRLLARPRAPGLPTLSPRSGLSKNSRFTSSPSRRIHQVPPSLQNSTTLAVRERGCRSALSDHDAPEGRPSERPSKRRRRRLAVLDLQPPARTHAIRRQAGRNISEHPADLTSSEKLSPPVPISPISCLERRRVVCVSSTVKLGERPVVVAGVVPDVGEGRRDRSASAPANATRMPTAATTSQVTKKADRCRVRSRAKTSDHVTQVRIGFRGSRRSTRRRSPRCPFVVVVVREDARRPARKAARAAFRGSLTRSLSIVPLWARHLAARVLDWRAGKRTGGREARDAA